MVRAVLLLVLVVGPVQAEPSGQSKPPECQSCNARHEQLKKLREARPPPKSTAPKPASTNGQGTEANTVSE